MYGTECARITGGKYSTQFILTYELTGQSIDGNYSNFTMRAYAYYGGGTHTTSSYSSIYITGTEVQSGGYTLYPGYTLLGYKNITIYHNSDGSFPGSNQGIGVSSYHISGEAWGNIYAPTINRYATVTNATNFNDEANPTIYFTNPANHDLYLKMEAGGNDYLITRNQATKSSPYTFSLTDAERKLLRQKATSNSLTVRFTVGTYINGSVANWSYVDRTMTIINANPTFSNFTYADVNTTTTALTGNNQKVVIGYSNVKATVSTANKATALKEATMKNYQLNCGTNTPVTITYSDSEEVSGTMVGVTNNTLNLLAVDSRGNTTTVSKVASYVNYTPLNKGSITFARDNGVSEETTLIINGKANLVNFGAKTNSIKTAQYRYKITSETTYSDYKNITLTIDSDGNFNFDDNIIGDTDTGFNIENSYNLEVLIKDELSSITYTATLGSGTPNMALAKNGVGIMGAYDDEVGGNLQLKGKKIGTPYVLYENASGSSGTITLSDSVENYDYLTIIYRDNDNYVYSVKIFDPNNHITTLLAAQPMTTSSNYAYLKMTTFYINETTISVSDSTRYKEIQLESSSVVSKSSNIFIKKVIGYK